MYDVVGASPKALAKVVSFEDSVGTSANPERKGAKYPFNTMLIGQAFAVPDNMDIAVASLRQSASNASKNGKKFCVIQHPEHKVYEVARIA